MDDPEYLQKDTWIPIGYLFPPYNKPVLITDGKSYQIRIFRLKDGIKYSESLSTNNMIYSPSHWRELPALPE